MPTDARLEIESIKLGTAAGLKKVVKVDKNAIALKVAFPRVGKPEVSAVRAVKAAGSGAPKLPDGSFSQRTVFKERFEGCSELTVEWIATDEVNDAEKFLRVLASAALTAGVGVATAGISSVVLAGVATAAGAFFADGVKKGDDRVTVIGRGCTLLNEADLAAGKSIEVTLTPPKPIKVRSRRTGRGRITASGTGTRRRPERNIKFDDLEIKTTHVVATLTLKVVNANVT